MNQKHDRTAIAESLLSLAQSGAPRPKHVEGLTGKFLSNFTCPTSLYYNAEVDQRLRAIRPDWFKKPRNNATAMKAKLLELARDGADRPRDTRHNVANRSYDTLANALTHYVSQNCRSFDQAFTDEIKTLRPDWFREGRTDLTKKQMLELAQSGGDRPEDSRLSKYTNRAHDQFDAVFDHQIRAARPDWFFDETARIKHELLERARSGGSRPSQKNTSMRLYRGFRRYTRANEKPDPAFIAELKAVRPDWFGPFKRVRDGRGWTLAT